MNLLRTLSVVLLISTLTSCFLIKEVTTNVVYRDSKSKKKYLTINTFTHSHCGCTDIYAQKFDKGKLIYAFYYGCTPFFKPEKVLNTYDDEMRLIKTERFDLVDSTNVDIVFDSLDTFVLRKMDSIRVNQKTFLEEYKLCHRKYKGLRSVR